MDFKIKKSPTEEISIPLNNGECFFVLGANGTGKSLLMGELYRQCNMIQRNVDSKRILANREITFQGSASDITSLRKIEEEKILRSYNANDQTRYYDNYKNNRVNICLYNLVDNVNARAREIAYRYDTEKENIRYDAQQKPSVIDQINTIFLNSNIKIKISINDNSEILASKNGSTLFSIAQLSDGERNALLIASDVLTASENSVLFIDEPERHLHRSISSPLLTELFSHRQDCIFVISTHEISLPLDNADAKILLLRDCDPKQHTWMADFIEKGTCSLPQDIRREILGAKKKVLFVEGTNNSLDLGLYQILFPELTVISKGTCDEVEKAAKGLRENHDLSWVDAFGLIDADNRSSDQINELKNKGIAVLDSYSIESLYYDLFVIEKFAQYYSPIHGKNANDVFNTIKSNFVPKIIAQKDRLCARIVERAVRKKVLNQMPNYNDILNSTSSNPITIDSSKELDGEKTYFDSLIKKNDINGIIKRYPIRESEVIGMINSALGLQKSYQQTFLVFLRNNNEVKNYLRKVRMKSLDDMII